MDKEQGEQRYANKISRRFNVRRGRCIRRYRHPRVGNTTSGSYARPCGNEKRMTRMFRKRLLEDIVKRGVCDWRPPKRSKLCRRFCGKLGVLAKKRHNKQQHTTCPGTRARRAALQAKRLIALPLILPGLFLCNEAAEGALYHEHGLTKKIHFGTVSERCSSLHHVPLAEKSCSFDQFSAAVRKVLSILELLPPTERIAFVCPGGVNRSVAMAAAVAVSYGTLSMRDALDYIDEQKTMCDPTWNHLTNYHLRKLLYAYASSLPR